MNRID
jgi:hypothetical protein